MDFIICEICSKKLKKITHSHLKFHNMTMRDYLEQFPNAEMESKDVKERKVITRKKTCLQKYGVDNVIFVDEINAKRIDKIKALHQDVNSTYNSEDFQRQLAQRVVDMSKCQDKAIANREKAVLAKYGVTHTFKLKEFQDRVVASIFKKYGVTNCMHIPEIAHKCLSKAMEFPNYAEKRLLGLNIEGIEYVGDFKLKIQLNNGRVKYPDFVVKDTKKLIEVFGEHFHTPQEEIEVIENYKNVGYECLVIWCSELKNLDMVKEKVLSYLQNPQRLYAGLLPKEG